MALIGLPDSSREEYAYVDLDMIWIASYGEAGSRYQQSCRLRRETIAKRGSRTRENIESLSQVPIALLSLPVSIVSASIQEAA